MRPDQPVDGSDLDGGDNRDILACEGSFNDGETTADRVEHHNDRMAISQSPGPSVRPPSTSHHPETVSRLLYPSRCPLSLTLNCNMNDNQRWTTLSSEDVGAHMLNSGNIGCPSSTPTSANRPNNIEILERVFPLQRRHILDLVLTECSGDLVKAIEQILSVPDAFSAHHSRLHHQQHLLRHQQLRMQSIPSLDHSRSDVRNGRSDGLPVGAASGPDGDAGSSILAPNSTRAALTKSVFAPLLPPPRHVNHSSFSPRAAAFATEALLAVRPPPPLGAVALPDTSRLLSRHPSLRLDGWIQSSVGAAFPSPAAMNPMMFGRHQLHQLEIPPAMFSGFQASLSNHYTKMMAAAAAGQVLPSRALDAASAGISHTVALSGNFGGIRGAMTNADQHTSVDQALDLHCRGDVSTS